MHIKKCVVYKHKLCLLWPGRQSRMLGEIYFRINGEQRREYWWWWGVVTPLWSDDASYTFAGRRVRSESPKTWGQEFGGLGKDGGEADQRFPYLILLQFLDIAGDSQVARSHAFCFCHSLCPVLHSCLPLCQHWKCHILIHPHCTEQWALRTASERLHTRRMWPKEIFPTDCVLSNVNVL